VLTYINQRQHGKFHSLYFFVPYYKKNIKFFSVLIFKNFSPKGEVAEGNIHRDEVEVNIYHLFTETEGNSVFCGSETAVVARAEAKGNNGGRGATKLTAFPRSQ
jgi:hypothetical protein